MTPFEQVLIAKTNEKPAEQSPNNWSSRRSERAKELAKYNLAIGLDPPNKLTLKEQEEAIRQQEIADKKRLNTVRYELDAISLALTVIPLPGGVVTNVLGAMTEETLRNPKDPHLVNAFEQGVLSGVAGEVKNVLVFENKK